jgi:hypothetical protein
MKTNGKIDIALPLSVAVSLGEDHAVMSGEFVGMYQAGFEAGYKSGKQAGYQQGFNEGIAAVHQGTNGASEPTASKGKPAPKAGPRRILLGMPCTICRVYLMSNETHCSCCKQLVKAA